MNNIRSMINKDIMKIVDMEHTQYGEEGYTKDDISNIIKGRNTNILICEDRADEILGYLIYNISKEKIYILRLVVSPEHQQKGIGRALLYRIKNKLNETRTILEMELEDDNIVGHLFLKNHGFNAVKILWGDSTENDLYMFQYNKNVPSKLP